MLSNKAIQNIRKVLLGAFRYSGAGAIVRNTAWRARRFLVLGWHGISLNDEHRWRPGLYISPFEFRQHLEAIRDTDSTVLSLDEALERVLHGSLPPKSVVLTFDDGYYDFYAAAAPILKEFGYPATIYLPTYHVDFQKPIFESILSYVLWKADRPCQPQNERQMIDQHAAEAMYRRILDQVRRDTSPYRKDELAREFACETGVDYDDLLRRRVLHLMNPAEIGSLASSGDFTFELHTHRHRTPDDPGLFARELSENQNRIRELTGRLPVHFCYPGGTVRPHMYPVLHQAGVRSAVTCEPGLTAELLQRSRPSPSWSITSNNASRWTEEGMPERAGRQRAVG